MVKCTGRSLIPISFDVFEKFMNSVVPSAKLPEFNVILDDRAKIKATFAQLEGVTLTIFTGPIISMGQTKLTDVSDVLTMLMLFTLYGVKKAGQGQNFILKTKDDAVAGLYADNDFQELKSKVHFFMEKFKPLNDQALASMPVVQQDQQEKTTKKAGVSPYKDIPLGDTPKIEVPENLDLRMV